MAKRIIGIILVVAALVTAVLGIVTAGKAPGNEEIIKNAVYVSDGKVLAENEGKVVIVPGTLNADLPFVDKETGIKLNSVVTYRKVEKLSIKEETEEKGETEIINEYWYWSMILDENRFGGSKKLIAPNVTLGEFSVAEELLQALTANQNRTEYTDKKELNQMGWNVFTDNGKTYLYQDEHMPGHEEDTYLYYDKYNSYLHYVDTLRVSYDEMDDNLEYTVIGLQQNGQLVKAPELDLLAIHSGQLGAEDLLAYAASSSKTSLITSVVIAVVLAGLGALLIVKGGKKEK